MKIIISVIITIHNAEKYLKECMDSVLSQTFSNIEILCMDGGSTDASPNILLEYAKKDKRIRIINDPNTSYGHKVNRGIEEAKGKYISVLESDDMYELDMLEKLYSVIEQYQVDFVNGNYTCFFDVEGKRCSYQKKMYCEEDYGHVIDVKEHSDPLGGITRFWTGLFSKQFLLKNNIKMNESPGASYQDMSFRFLTSILAKKIYHINKSVYWYRIDNPESSMFNTTKTVIIADEHKFLKEELVKRGITDDYVWHQAYQWKYCDFHGNMFHLEGKYRKELFNRYLEEIEKDRDEISKYWGNGYAQMAQDLMNNDAETVEFLVEQEIRKRQEEKEKWYQFLKRLVNISDKEKVILFGCGHQGSIIMERIKFLYSQICCVIDNKEEYWGKKFFDFEVCKPEKACLLYPDAYYIVANKNFNKMMSQQLIANGVKRERIVVF